MRLIERIRSGGKAWAVAAATPLAVVALSAGVAAMSAERPDVERTAAALAKLTGGDLSARGLAAVTGRLDPAQLALARRFDPGLETQAAPLGLTPGWESLTLGGKPGLALGPSGLEAQKLNAATPAIAGTLRPARPFALTTRTVADRGRALRCLTQAIYYEAALESTAGQEAVAQVVLNRVRDPNYPASICGVVYQGAERDTGCQFSFTCDGSLAQAPVGWAWDRARKVAERAAAGYVAAQVGTATHYHADYVHPWWSPTLNKIDQIGAHIFYRWKGFSGETAAFSQAYSGREPVIDEKRFARPRLAVATTDDAAAAVPEGGLRTVEINGATRVVGVANLGGRRLPSREEVAAINERIAAFEAAPIVVPKAPEPAPEGVTPMAVEEVGKPAGS